MKIQGADAFFKDGVLAVKKELNLSSFDIEGIHYSVRAKKQSEFNSNVYLYYVD